GGKITYMGVCSDVKAADTVDLSGKYILPGCIDSHLHFQDPGFTEREDFEHGTAACAAGGVTTGISMPMNDPPVVDLQSYEFTKKSYAGRSFIDYALHAGATADNGEQLEALWTKTGAAAVKMFMCFSVADFPYVDDAAFWNACCTLAKVGGVIMVHAENDAILKATERKLKSAGRIDGLAHIQCHSILAENEAIERALFFIERSGVRAVICHVSNAQALRMIHEAQLRGVDVFAESAPHMFAFEENDISAKGPYLKFSPVMHDKTNQEAMWDLIGRGYVQTIGSDHSPYTLQEKIPGEENIWNAPNGIPGVETSLAVFLDGVNKGKLSLERVVEMTSCNPAKIYGLYPRKGALEIGADADIIAIDMDRVHTYTAGDIKSKCKWSPYVDMSFKGWPVMTAVRGEIIYSDGKIVGKAGYGQYVERKK
ncbi:MAG: amidohydrolase family protein, partial [Oscillospiraceae bacterium]|nr:amidohydrolase family protein [Oscillospiraceae bacterium]